MKTTSLKTKGSPDTILLKKRLKVLRLEIESSLELLSVKEQQSLLTLRDVDFWSAIQLKTLAERIISTPTPEKTEQNEFAENRVAFMEYLQEYGGVHKSSAVEKIIHASVPTVIKYGEKNKLIVLNWGAENLYPVFQFSTNEKNSEKGMLKGVPELLASMKHEVSAVRKCNFFLKKVELPLTEEKISILEVLRRGAKKDEMEYFKILAENLGTQNAV
ncbi:hypothetical protein J6836_22315 (plasmid) [Providencia sp. R33]|uniref:hypothetical protein n=1 Tax=Providencia sp. R33 TaxID=2828763 RepID=UPI001C5A9657|nr:hypothetical protein [Providencia sp. R33]QXX85096.1 hypothetical protein J6836_22315 [Providencia sp. R33]